MASMANAAAISSNFSGLRLNSMIQFCPKSRKLSCSRKDVNSNSLMGPAKAKLESDDAGHYEHLFSSSESGVQTNNADIWKLFNDAQRNIMLLNKQRLLALEELKKVESEKQLLLERIKQLEAANQPGTGDASDLRKMIKDNKGSISDVFFDTQQKNDLELLSELRQFFGRITREMEPIASFGPLASYVTGLSCALQRKGYTVEVILPNYASIDLAPIKAIRKIEAEIGSYFGGCWHRNRIWSGIVNNIGVMLIEPHHQKAFFNRDRLYGYSDDFMRFAYFSRASLDYIVKAGKQPDI